MLGGRSGVCTSLYERHEIILLEIVSRLRERVMMDNQERERTRSRRYSSRSESQTKHLGGGV